MSTVTVKTTLYVTLEGPSRAGDDEGRDLELEVEVEGEAYAYVPARLNGHPDTWSPAEGGEVETTSVKVGGEDFELTRSQEVDARVALAEASNDAWAARREDYDEARAEAAWDSRYDV